MLIAWKEKNPDIENRKEPIQDEQQSLLGIINSRDKQVTVSDRAAIKAALKNLLKIILDVHDKIYNAPRKMQNKKFLIKWQNQKFIHTKQMDNNCLIPDLIQSFSDVDN